MLSHCQRFVLKFIKCVIYTIGLMNFISGMVESIIGFNEKNTMEICHDVLYHVMAISILNMISACLALCHIIFVQMINNSPDPLTRLKMEYCDYLIIIIYLFGVPAFIGPWVFTIHSQIQPICENYWYSNNHLILDLHTYEYYKTWFIYGLMVICLCLISIMFFDSRRCNRKNPESIYINSVNREMDT